MASKLNKRGAREMKSGQTLADLLVNPLACDSVDVTKLKRVNMPPIVKPATIPVGKWVQGELMAVVDSPNEEIDGKLLRLKYGEQEFLFPLTGQIAAALGAEPEKYVGQKFAAKRGPDGASKKYGGNRMFSFEVFIG